METTPLDTLKELAHSVGDMIEHAQDMIGGSSCGDEHETALDVLDSARYALVAGLAVHIAGMERDPDAILSGFSGYRYTPAAWAATRSYDNGDPVCVQVEVGNGQHADYYPRRDGDLDAFKALFAPRLSLVGGPE